jgi:hypothetical protein
MITALKRASTYQGIAEQWCIASKNVNRDMNAQLSKFNLAPAG